MSKPSKIKLSEQHNHPIEKLIEVMAALRNPEGGCPWDLEQTFKTIAPFTLEEAYEVADAIDRDDMNSLREELGDLLLQPIYHAQMAAEAGHFNIGDVIDGITEKMISRHPHVFGDKTASSASDVNKIWDERKNAENKTSDGALSGIAQSLPSLLYAQKLTRNAARVGFEWPTLERIWLKVEEEIAELKEAVEKGTPEDQEEELGDVLFVLANYGRKLGINAEEALRKANNKFKYRFNGLEKEFKSKNKELKSVPLDQMEQEWVRQKQKQKN